MSPTITIAASAHANKASKSVYTRPQRKSKMSVTQTYFLAHSARGKLSREASRADHDLRLLVGHANMLDSLMIDLHNAEQDQERWFNRSVLGADLTTEEEEEEDTQAHPETIVEEPESDWEAEDAQTSEDESEYGDDLNLARTISHHSPPELTTSDSDSDSDDEQMPPSPENSAVDLLAQKQRQAMVTSSYYEVKETPISETDEDDFYLPSRSQPTIIAAN